MEDPIQPARPVEDPAATPPASSPSATPEAPRPPRRWLRALLYMLAGVGVLALALVGLMFYAHSREEKGPGRVTIDEAAVIESVMADTYGKYSEAKKGWLFVDEDNVTYLMRVVQQTKIADKADGDELYFVASGAAVDGSGTARYGVFYIHPNPAHDGLTQEHQLAKYWSTEAVKPEQVHFEALAENLWGWVIRRQIGTDPKAAEVTSINSVVAPHDGQVVEVAEFMASSDRDPGVSCDAANTAWEAWRAKDEELTNAETAAPEEISEQAAEEHAKLEEPVRCDKRRWSYRTATVNGTIPVPITVTLGGSQYGKPVEAKTWKLMFDPKSFSYNVPDDMAAPRGEE